MNAAPPAQAYHLYVGVDIAAATLTAAWTALRGTPTRPKTYPQTAAGYAEFQRHLLASATAPEAILIVMEATGTYWVSLATTLVTAGFAVSVINPLQASAFAKALLRRNKTDAIDAETLARLAATLQPARWTPPPAIYTELQQRLTQRDALIELRQHVRNQLHALIQHPVVVPSVRARLEALIETLSEQIAELDRELAAALQQDQAWAAAAARLQTITGIGLVTTGWLLVSTLNFTLCETAEAATGYAGLAPTTRSSGTSVRGRVMLDHRGNGHLRRALYLATLSAARSNPVIKTFYERLRAAGKPPKVARCAAARKLLHIAWAVVTKEQDFDPEYRPRQQLSCAT